MPEPVWLAAQAIKERMYQARFSDTRLTGDQQHLTLAGFCQRPSLQQHRKLVAPPDKPRQGRAAGGIEAAFHAADAGDTVKMHPAFEALERSRPEVLELEHVA